jgi:RES domain-containing protein
MVSGAALSNVLQTLASQQTRPRRGTYFRATPLICGTDPLGKNRPINAQRFNCASCARVLYLGDEHATCMDEVQAFGFPASSVSIVPVEFVLNSVLDLTDQSVQQALQTDQAELGINFRSLPRGAPPAPSQELGEACAALTGARIDGLLYESVARPGHLAIAVIEAALAALGSSLKVNDPSNNLFDSLP